MIVDTLVLCHHDRIPAEHDDVDERPPLLHTIRSDFAAATGWKVLGVALLLSWMAFQWGLGNDILLPSLAASVLDAIDDRETWPSAALAVLATGLTGFAFWGAVQGLDAVITMSGLRLVPGITARISGFLRRKGLVTPYDEMRWATRWIIAYATGVSLLCLVDVFATGRPGLRSRRTMIVVSAVLSAATVGTIVTLLATAAVVARRVPATETAAEIFIRFAKNPLTWIVIFATVYGVSRLRSRRAEATTTR